MRILSMILGVLMLTATAAAAQTYKDPENTLLLQLKDGTVVIQMRPDLAPKHVAQIKQLTREKFYDGIVFHRVIEGFMAQTGDPTGTGSGNSELPDIQAEFSTAKHIRGTVSMARTNDPNSANSQWFICFKPVPQLDGQYTIWGQVIQGMEFVDNIKKGNPEDNGSVSNPDKIVTLRIAADVENEKSKAAQ
ncbi:MAG: peptidylprolyl isomerase [Rickettsiales bacterium]